MTRCITHSAADRAVTEYAYVKNEYNTSPLKTPISGVSSQSNKNHSDKHHFCFIKLLAVPIHNSIDAQHEHRNSFGQ